MKFILTNDDGIDAPGLAALADAARQAGAVVVVAPAVPQSGCSHRVTTDGPLRVAERTPGRIAVEGTPADCVRVALHRFAGEAFWVLSGVNEGGNLGTDVHHSGTVAAVREAALHGLPGVAFSQYRRKGLAFDWRRTAAWALPVLRDLLARPLTPGAFWNVNLPHLNPDAPDPECVFCPLDPFPLPLSYRQEGNVLRYNGDYHGRRREAGSDVDVCFNGRIAVTELKLL
jgi:5'-nucleotidase